MPVTISKIITIDQATQAACERILKTLPTNTKLDAVWQRYLNEPNPQALWVGWFNDRIVGFIVLEGHDIQALVVHSATQGRGVGTRMAQLINESHPDLTWPLSLKHFE